MSEVEDDIPVLDFPVTRTGDTFQGGYIPFQDVDENLISLTGVTIAWAFRRWSPHGQLDWTWTVGDGLSLDNGDQHLVIEPFDTPSCDITYHHDLQFIWPNGWKQTILKGEFPFSKDVTP